jgi:hypothetical protein
MDALQPHLDRLLPAIKLTAIRLICAAHQRGWNDGAVSKTGKGRPKKTFDEKIVDVLATPVPIEKGDWREKRLQRARRLR